MITLTTDFGLNDTFVGVMKGVILSIAPSAKIVDLSHGLPQQDIVAGALALEESCAFFPDGTIHVAVVDPGVGSARTAVALETERAFFVGPDNGIFELVLTKDRLKRAVKLENPRYWLPAVCATFHGRDIFAPAAAHLANGVELSEFGPPCEKLVALNLHGPCEHGAQLKIHVLRADHFGNLITDLTHDVYAKWNPENTPLNFEFAHSSFMVPVSSTFSDVPEGSPVAYFGSGGRLEIGIRNGNAAAFFKAGKGFSITVGKV
ncbi:MAG TPA: SAM-dependent chlorinase/fluorinase [Planctomycetota bacterium]|nr:SAM-dependent chlorinase/fluorinase [Planctomycetota bacterium]